MSNRIFLALKGYDRYLQGYLKDYEKYLQGMVRKALLGKFKEEQKKVPPSVKKEVFKRAVGKCEWPRCQKRLRRSQGEFHHWTDNPTERTTAFLCHMHHRDKKYKTHTIKVNPYGLETVRVVRRKRIPIKPKPKSKAVRKKRDTKTRKKRR